MRSQLCVAFELCAAMCAHNCDTRQSCRLVTIETLITILTIENLNSWQSLLPDNQEWQWTAFAILAMFFWRRLNMWDWFGWDGLGENLCRHRFAVLLKTSFEKNHFQNKLMGKESTIFLPTSSQFQEWKYSISSIMGILNNLNCGNT